jgi:hypothetical protein
MVVSNGPPSSSEEPVCVVTRISFPSWRSIPGAVFRFRRLRRVGRRMVPGLVDARLHLRGNSTLLFVSLWRNELALVQFTTLEAHGTSSMSAPWLGTIRHWQPLAASAVEPVAADES